MENRLVPGTFVRHPSRPDRVTVNFENAGKRLVNAAVVELEVVDADAGA